MRTPDGRFRIRLSDAERQLLGSVATHLGAALAQTEGGAQDPSVGGDPGLARLFPDAYRDDPQRSAEWRKLIGDQLSAAHRGALATLAATARADQLGEDELLSWLRAINQARLLLGTRLELTEDRVERPFGADDPRAAALEAYDWLSWFQDQLLDALGQDAG